MIVQTTPDPELLFLPEWAAAVLYFATIPLGLLVGYLAYLGFRRAGRREARILAIGLVLLTAVDAALGTTIALGGTTVVDRSSAIIRGFVQLVGICCIVYAMYVPPNPEPITGEAETVQTIRDGEEVASDAVKQSSNEEDESR